VEKIVVWKRGKESVKKYIECYVDNIERGDVVETSPLPPF